MVIPEKVFGLKLGSNVIVKIYPVNIKTSLRHIFSSMSGQDVLEPEKDVLKTHFRSLQRPLRIFLINTYLKRLMLVFIMKHIFSQKVGLICGFLSKTGGNKWCIG